MPGSADDFLRQMAKGNLRLVLYHVHPRGTKKLDHAELQTMDVKMLNMRSSGFKGPATVPLDAFNDMLQLKLIEMIGSQSDASQSIFHLTEAGRNRGLRD